MTSAAQAAGALTRTAGALADAAREARRSWRWPASVAAAGVVFGVALPFLLDDPLRVQGLASGLYLALAAVGLAFAVGLAGMPSLGQGAFMAIGAFTTALLRAKAGADPLGATLAGLVVATLAGVVIGLAVVRLGRVLFAVVTWLLAWLVALGLAAFPAISGGAQGLFLPTERMAGLRMTPTFHYELALVLIGLAALALYALRRGRPGLSLAGLRQRPAAAAGLGVRATRLRLGAFVASAGIGGLAGALGVQLAGIAAAEGYGPFLSFKLFVAVLLGGMAAALGGPAGIAVLSALNHLAHWIGSLERLSTARYEPMIAALLLLLVLGLGGHGLLPWLWRLLPARRRAAPAASRARRNGRVRDATLTAHEIRKRFGGVVAVADLSLDVRGGSILALIGPNGSGKTTALRILSGTMPPDGGRVAFDGRTLDGTSVQDRAALGIVRTLQRTAVFEALSTVENVLVGAALNRRYGGAVRTVLATPKERRESARIRSQALRALDEVGLGPVAELRASALTGSQQRLLMLASALAAEPRVLLLDEISAGGTVEDVRHLGRILAELRERGLAMLLVEHNLRLVRAVADHVVVLDQGRVIAAGEPDEVRADTRVQEAYLGRHAL